MEEIDIKICLKNKFFLSFLVAWYKNGAKTLTFDDQCINKNAFYKNKKPSSIDEVEIKTMVLSSIHLYGNKDLFKYFIGYTTKTNAFPIPLCINLPQIDGCTKYFNNNN